MLLDNHFRMLALQIHNKGRSRQMALSKSQPILARYGQRPRDMATLYDCAQFELILSYIKSSLSLDKVWGCYNVSRTI
jgi:hypothetical protein